MADNKIIMMNLQIPPNKYPAEASYDPPFTTPHNIGRFGHYCGRCVQVIAPSALHGQLNPTIGESNAAITLMMMANASVVLHDESCSSADEHSVNTDPEQTFTLYSPSDEGRISDAHTIFRRDIYEGFIITKDDNIPSRIGTVAFRCRFCKHLPEGARGAQSKILPRTIGGLYRAQIRFQRDHFPYCAHTPRDLKVQYMKVINREGRGRGSKHYWVTSALRKGLKDGPNGIVFCG